MIFSRFSNVSSSRNILEFELFHISTTFNKLTKNSDGKTLCFEYSRPFPTLFSRISYLTVKFASPSYVKGVTISLDFERGNTKLVNEQ